MTFEEAKARLSGLEGDDEAYHSAYDKLIEERLGELDPEFMRKMNELYEQSGASRWCS